MNLKYKIRCVQKPYVDPFFKSEETKKIITIKINNFFVFKYNFLENELFLPYGFKPRIGTSNYRGINFYWWHQGLNRIRNYPTGIQLNKLI